MKLCLVCSEAVFIKLMRCSMSKDSTPGFEAPSYEFEVAVGLNHTGSTGSTGSLAAGRQARDLLGSTWRLDKVLWHSASEISICGWRAVP